MLIRIIRETVICAFAMAAISVAQSTPAPQNGASFDAPSASRQSGPATRAVSLVRQAVTALPADVAYKPLSSREKFRHFVGYTYSPYTLGGVLYSAAWAQATGDPYEYGGGMEGFGKRVGASLASTEAGSFFGSFLFPVLLKQDPRYFPARQGGVFHRGIYALSRVAVARSDKGNLTFNSAGLLGVAFNAALKNAYMPEGRRSIDTTFNRMAGALQGQATTYVFQEFGPDLFHILYRLSPKRLRKMESRIPPSLTAGVRPEAD